MRVIWILPLLLGCTTTPLSPNADSINEASLYRLLKHREFQKAAVYRYYFTDPRPAQAELMAQYYLGNCEPTKAYKVIQEIPDEHRRTIYEATLLALVSVKRPENLAPLDLDNEKEDSAGIKTPVSGEVWADEWKDIQVTSDCETMPLVQNPQLREQYQAKARALFASLRPEDWPDDFGVASLALDVGVRFDNRDELLKRYQAFHDSPYYQRLAQQHDVEMTPLQAANVKGAQIEFGDFQLGSVETVPHAIRVPVLLK